MIRVASLRYGVIFNKAFSNPAIFTGFVKDILGIDIEIDRVETEKSFSPPVGNVESRFDLFAEDKKNRLIIDIQHRRYPDHYDRFLHYHSVALIEQITNAYNYKPDMNVYTIVVLTSGDKHKTDVLINDFRPRKLDDSCVPETQHKIVYLCPKYVTDETPEPYKQWLRAINDSLDNEVEESDYESDVIRDVFSLIKENEIDPKEKFRMIDEYSDEQYVKEKKEEAREEGKQEGRQKGIHEAMEKTAKAMIAQGLELSLISEITGISEEDLQGFK